MTQDFQQNSLKPEPVAEAKNIPLQPDSSVVPETQIPKADLRVQRETSQPEQQEVKPITSPLPEKLEERPTPPWVNVNEAKEEEKQPTVKKEPESMEEEKQEENVVKESIFKKLIPLAGILLLLLVVGFIIFKVILPILKKGKDKISGIKTSKSKEISLVYWGLWEPENIMSSLISEYKKSHPGITIDYIQQSHNDYRERLQSALAQGTGPDIFRIHSTWLPMFKKDLAPMPADISQSLNLSQNFYSVIVKALKNNGQFLAMPLEFDGLSLFYNTKIFDEAGKKPPATWDNLRQIASDLTVKDKNNKIKIAGVALGTTNNVDNFSDILGLMMLQNRADLNKPSGSLAEDALKFYTLFSMVDKVWDQSLPPSTYAFAQGKVAMILAPSWRIHEIKEINPQLKFKTAPVPQLPEIKVSWASFWVEAVAKDKQKSQKSQAAWDFLSFLASKKSLTEFYDNAAQVRGFGEPYSRIDMASLLESDPLIGSFIKQAPYAQTWYLCSRTHDNGINDKMIKYFEDAVNAVINGQQVTASLTTASQGVAQVLKQYGIK